MRLLAKLLQRQFYSPQTLMWNMSRIMASTLVLAELVESTLGELIREMRVTHATLLLIRDDEVFWVKNVGKENSKDYSQADVVSILNYAAELSSDQILLTEKVEKLEIKEKLQRYGVAVTIPLRVERKTIGGIFLTKKENNNLYSSDDLSILRIFGPEISVAVQNSLSYEEINRFNRTLQNEIQKATDTVRSVNEQMYMKNLELSETNKTLSLLRKIDDAVLHSVTNTALVGQDVANIIVRETDFSGMLVVLHNKKEKAIIELATAPTQLMDEAKFMAGHDLRGIMTPIANRENTLVQTVISEQKIVTDSLYEVLTPHFSRDAAHDLQKKSGIVSVVVYPMIVHGETIGAVAIALGQSYLSISDHRKDLISRLVSITGIAIDNALLYQRIQEANERLKQLDQLKDEFVSVASHELRTPMTAIKSYLWLALAGKGGELNEKLKFYLDRSYTSTNRLIKLVNDMLNVTRIESGRMSFEIQKVDMPQLVEEMISEVKPRADELGIKIISPTLQEAALLKLPSVLADPDKIKEIMINLIGNSLKFTHRGGNISIAYEVKDDMLITKVSDNGEGIEADDISKLFQKFSLIKGSYQTNKQSSQGTGLGLYISKMIMKEHGGDIWAESAGRGKGATFGFSLKKFNQTEFESFQKTAKKEGLGIIHSEV